MFPPMPIMMQPFLRTELFARHINMPLQVSATAGVPSRSPIGQPGRGHPSSVSHHIKPGGLQSQLHSLPGMSVSVHPSANLQQPRSPSPQSSQDSTTFDGPKGEFADIFIRAAPDSLIFSAVDYC